MGNRIWDDSIGNAIDLFPGEIILNTDISEIWTELRKMNGRLDLIIHTTSNKRAKLMPIKPENKALYPTDWKQISKRIRFERANNHCEFCGCENYEAHPITGSRVVLTVAHLDHDPTNSIDENLRALCQKCHNAYDASHRAQSRKKV